MNILRIVNSYVCPYASIPRLTSLIGNNEQIALDLKSMVRMAGEDIARRGEWQQMFKSLEIAAGTTNVALPDDFHRIIQGNAIEANTTPYTPIPYIRSSDVWSGLTNNASSQPYFTIRNGNIRFLPATPFTSLLRYISTNWVLDTGGNEQEDFTSDDDEPMFSSQLLGLGTLYRLRRAKGLQYQDVADEFEAKFELELRADRGIG